MHMLSAAGRILGEMTVSRLADDRFYALSAAAAELRDRDLLEQSLHPGEAVRIENVTEAYGVLVLSGPRSRELLNALTDADLGNEQFRWLTAREISVAGIHVRALRVSYVGELGGSCMRRWPRWGAVRLLSGRKAAHSVLPIMDCTRSTACGLRRVQAWSTELTNELNMIEADMLRFVNFNKEDFVGKAAMLAQRRAHLKSCTPNLRPRIRMRAVASLRCIGSAALASRRPAPLATVSRKAFYLPASSRNSQLPGACSTCSCKATGAKPRCSRTRPTTPKICG